jgi:hypothetical protein
MNKWNRSYKIALFFFLIVYLLCWMLDAFGSPSIKPYSEVTGHIIVLLFLFLWFLDEKAK